MAFIRDSPPRLLAGVGKAAVSAITDCCWSWVDRGVEVGGEKDCCDVAASDDGCVFVKEDA